MKAIKKFFKGIFIFFCVILVLGLVGTVLGDDDKENAEVRSTAAESTVPAQPVPEAAPDPAETAPTPVESAPTEAPAPADGIRPEIREALEAYEEFMDEYCRILSDYYENSGDLTIAMKYLEFAAKAEEMEAKMEALDSDLNDAEMHLYLEVMLRCEQKLLAVME